MTSKIQISKKLVLINSASSLGTKLVSIAAMIWVQQYLLKRIPVDEYSLLPVIYSLIIFLPFFTEVFAGGIKRYVVEAYAIGDCEGVSRIVSTMFPLLCACSVLIVSLGGLFAWYIDTILNISPQYVNQARLLITLIFGVEGLRLAAQAFNSGFAVTQRFLLQNLITISCEALRITILVFLLLSISVSVTSVVVSTTVAGVLEIIILLLVSRHLVPEQRFDLGKFDMQVFKRLIRFGGWSSLNSFSGMVRKSADPIILNRLASPIDVACFNLGALIPNRMEVIINQSFLGSVLSPVIALNADNRKEKLKSLYLRIGRYALWGTLFICAPFIVFNQQVVSLYVGNEFLQAGTVLLLLFACYPFVYGNALYTVLANAKVRMKEMAIRESLSAFLNLVLTLLLVGYFQMGATGSALATFLIYGLGSMIIFLPFGKGMVEASWSEFFNQSFIPGIVPFVAAITTMKTIDFFRPAEFWLDLFNYSVAGSLVYCLVALLVAKNEDRTQIQEAFAAIRNRIGITR